MFFSKNSNIECGKSIDSLSIFESIYSDIKSILISPYFLKFRENWTSTFNVSTRKSTAVISVSLFIVDFNTALLKSSLAYYSVSLTTLA